MCFVVELLLAYDWFGTMLEGTVDRTTIRKLPTIAIALLMAACAVRQVNPVAMSQPGDEQLTCANIRDQIKLNAADAANLLRRDREIQTANTVKLFFGLLGAGLSDLSRDEQVKARSMIDRNERLSLLLQSKECGEL